MPDRELTPEQRDLAGRYFPLAVGMARRSGQMTPELEEDMISHCASTLCEAAYRFRPGKASFYTFVRQRLRGAIVDRIRSLSQLTRTGKNRPSHAPFDFRGTGESRIALRDSGFSRIDDRDHCEYMVRHLDAREAAVIASKYWRDTGLRGAANQLGISESMCCLIHAAAVEKLRERFWDERKTG